MLGNKELKVLYSEEDIATRVAEMGRQITADHQGTDLVVVSVLKGSFVFVADLVRHIDLPCSIDFLGLSSYGEETKSSGGVEITRDLSLSITGKNVLVVEDIVDTGLTIEFLYNRLMEASPLSLKFVTCLLKPVKQKIKEMIEYTGFEISDSFVVGYGLDYAQKFRGLPSIYSLKEKKGLE